MRSAAFNTGPDFHLLDHIAPLAIEMDMPLIVTDELNEKLARAFYPQAEVRHMPDLEANLSLIAEEFDALFECKYWASHLKTLFRQLYKKEMRLIFCPHGQSDKGYRTPLLAPFATQDIVLIYGDLLIQMLKDLNVWSSISHYAIVGNYRLRFYQKNRMFYDCIAREKTPLNPKNQTLLYAPTWRDADGASSFLKYGAKVISELPSDWNLIVKIHPLLEQRDPAYFYSIAALIDKKPNGFLIHECPPVYPFLALADIYLGDASSVGYDFLYFQRPLYFFPSEEPRLLHSCGRMIDPTQNIYSQLETSNPYKAEQERLYRFAFCPSGETGLRDFADHAVFQ